MLVMNEKTGNLTEKKKTHIHTHKKQMKVLKIKISEV